MTQTCFERYRKVTDFLSTMAKVVGGDLTNPNFKYNFVTITIGIATLFFFGCVGYTIHVGYTINDDWTVILQALCISASALEGWTKYFACLVNQKTLVRILAFTHELYAEYEQKDGGYRQILWDRTTIIFKIIGGFLMIYLGLFVSVVLFPIVYYFLYEKKVLAMEFILPGVNPNTFSGYLIHYALHIGLLTVGCFGNYAGDMYLFVYTANIPLVKDIVRCKFHDLNEVLLETHNPKKTKPMLDDIICWHQKYINLIQDTEQVFFPVVFLQIFATSFAIISTLFCIFIDVWPAAYAYLIYSLFILYAYCGLGTFVDSSNDDFCSMIYTDCLWYELSVPEQKMIILMLEKAQNAKSMTVGKIMPLSMSSGLQLTKAIYSYIMLLLQFLE